MSDKIKLTGYKKITYTCNKCSLKTTVETDYLSEAQAKTLHRCRKEKK